ncbi:hypothetical protein GGR34_000737 [Microvirga flocculans]|uniref:Uncharacterized protein n=1 Tax=Microvirga flocculans TaxID=217168 RepID=A0A7W6ICT7_9HYPH|nr:hypothetical protein [Microvirga flocculans]MBB4039102.1 hypothetical protein [Microvirga flocculans]
MTKRLVNIGEGRIIEMAEGEGKKPSPKPRKPRAKKPGPKRAKRKKSQSKWGIKQPGKGRGRHVGTSVKMALIPGYREWWNLRQKQNSEYMIGSRSRLGVPDGMRKAEALKAWAEARRKAEIHMANMKKAGLLPDDEIVQKATQATLEILEGPMNQDMKLKAARQLLDFYKAKPASKSEVTVNAAEAWLASLAEAEGDKE